MLKKKSVASLCASWSSAPFADMLGKAPGSDSHLQCLTEGHGRLLGWHRWRNQVKGSGVPLRAAKLSGWVELIRSPVSIALIMRLLTCPSLYQWGFIYTSVSNHLANLRDHPCNFDVPSFSFSLISSWDVDFHLLYVWHCKQFSKLAGGCCCRLSSKYVAKVGGPEILEVKHSRWYWLILIYIYISIYIYIDLMLISYILYTQQSYFLNVSW